VFHGAVDVLDDALSVEDVAALGLNGIFGQVETDPANRCFSFVVRHELAGVRLTSENQIWMASHLSHACKPEERSIQMHVRVWQYC
jgi:hypothetical protein